MKIGILALQGAFAEHAAMLKALGVPSCFIRRTSELSDELDGLILPGGESTAMQKLLHDSGLFAPILARIRSGMPVFGTCAGLLLLAGEIDGGTPCFATMELLARRNAYGRQLGSFHTESRFEGVGTIPMTFIRAPYIERVGRAAQALATVDGKIVAARQDRQLVTAFHPELCNNPAVHRYFLQMCSS